MADEQFKIEIISTADTAGFTATTKAVDGLNSSTKEGASAHEKLAQATKTAEHATEAAGIPHRELRKILLDVGNVAAPGAGRALMELGMGPIGVALALVGVFEMFKKTLEADEEEADKLGEILGQPFGISGIEAVQKKWDDASAALGKYSAAYTAAGHDDDPEATALKRSKELIDTKIAALKKEVQAQAEVEQAAIRANGATNKLSKEEIERQVETAKGRTRQQLDNLDNLKDRATGSGALQQEQRERTTNDAGLQQAARHLLDIKSDTDTKFAADQAELKKQRELIGLGEGGADNEKFKAFQKQREDAESALADAKAMPDIVSGMGVGPDIDQTDAKRQAVQEAQDKVDSLARIAAAARQEVDRLARSEAQRSADKDLADKAAEDATAESSKNAGRLKQLPGEIAQAKRVEQEKGFGTVADQAGQTQVREIAAAHTQSMAEAVGALQAGYLSGQALLKASKEAAAAHSEQAGLLQTMLVKQRELNLAVQRQIAALTKTAGGG